MNINTTKRAVKKLSEHIYRKDYQKIILVIAKASNKVIKYLLSPIGLIIAIVVRILSPWVIIRMDVLVSDRIGHFAANTELYLCEKDFECNLPVKKNIKYYDIWYQNWPISNKQLAKMWNRKLHIWPSLFMYSADNISRKLPGSEKFIIPPNANLDRDVHNLLDKSSAHLEFTEDEELLGKKGMGDMGIPQGCEFVCLNVRDSSYLDKAMPWKRWDYHDYRDADINNYVSAAEALTERGYYVVRMGAFTKNQLKTNNPRVIDYATNGMRSDFMDIYLGAKCRFCISTSTGFDAIPVIFRRPVLYTDFTHAELFNSFTSKSMTYFKHHYLEAEGRNMKISEIINSGVGRYYYTSLYKDHGIRLIGNSPEEIKDASLEMDDRISGVFNHDADTLQNDMVKLFSASKLHGEIRSRIATRCLLDDHLL